MQQVSNSILSSLGIDSSDFLYSTKISLYDDGKKKPYGRITFDKGKYRLTIGDLNLCEVSNRHYDR